MMALVYSCCFWFSLRLGGILIGIFSVATVVIVLSASCVSYDNPQIVKDEIAALTNDLDLIYTKAYLDSVQEDPQKYLSIIIGLTCLYIVACISFIYGAFTYTTTLMVIYIIMELLRLILISTLVATSLLLIKQNTMDIGFLIGASVAGGFLLLGMFYLWLCAANLPIVINEMEREDQANAIDKLRELLEINNPRTVPPVLENFSLAPEPDKGRLKPVFIVPTVTNKSLAVDNKWRNMQRVHSRIPKPFLK